MDYNNLKALMESLPKMMNNANAFLVVIKGVEKRYTNTLIVWLSEMEKLFGTDFWNHVIIVVSHWSYSKHDRHIRNELVPRLDENQWRAETRSFLSTHFRIKKTIPIVFVDSHYEHKGEEAEFFASEVNKLHNLLRDDMKPKFFFKNVDVVKSELLLLQEKVLNLTAAKDALEIREAKLSLEKANFTIILANYSSISANSTSTVNDNSITQFDYAAVILVTSVSSCMITVLVLLMLVFFYKACRKNQSIGDSEEGSDNDETASKDNQEASIVGNSSFGSTYSLSTVGDTSLEAQLNPFSCFNC